MLGKNWYYINMLCVLILPGTLYLSIFMLKIWDILMWRGVKSHPFFKKTYFKNVSKMCCDFNHMIFCVLKITGGLSTSLYQQTFGKIHYTKIKLSTP